MRKKKNMMNSKRIYNYKIINQKTQTQAVK